MYCTSTYIFHSFNKFGRYKRDGWFLSVKNQRKILKLLKLREDNSILVRRFAERGVERASKRVGCSRYGDREELFLFKEERLVYLRDLFLFLLRRDRFSSIPNTSNKNCNQHTKFLYHYALTHVVGGDHDTEYPVEVFTGNRDCKLADHHQMWEPATLNRIKTTVTLVTDGRYCTAL